MRRENPRTFRLSREALDALDRLAAKADQKAAAVVEELILAADAESREQDLRACVEGLRQYIGEMSARVHKLEGLAADVAEVKRWVEARRTWEAEQNE